MIKLHIHMFINQLPSGHLVYLNVLIDKLSDQVQVSKLDHYHCTNKYVIIQEI